MQGAGILYNTYWVRFERGRTTFDRAVENSSVLFEAAAKAGINRIVHISVSNASSGSSPSVLQGQGASGGIAEGSRRSLRHNQADPDLWRAATCS